ncbi:S8 family peptidase [Bacillus sp. FJAT-45037]|uniref:S8 family peptidase n=1 Tax=Bacillus sp. FJAT-45037 TaxID=2011007 RepID=UPI000C24FA74|nr:S8 family peptidase [Bacillus sp. FJAT-45037]
MKGMKVTGLLLGLVLAVVFVFSTLSVSANGKGVERVEYLIGFHEKANKDEVNQAGGEVVHEFTYMPVLQVKIPERAAKALENNPNIAFVEKNEEVTATQTVPWGITHIKAPTVHSWGNRGGGVKVAILDTGVANHPDLQISGGASFIGSEPSYQDLNGHGTHVAGTVAALNNSYGVLGVAPSSSIYAVKVLDRNGGGSHASIAQGIEWSISNGMDIVNMSLGGPTGSNTLKQAVDNAYNLGVLLVAASGNTGTAGIQFPARYNTVMAVGAVDSRNRLASFSTFGNEQEIVAPGVNVQSTHLSNGYVSLNGTSMASPHVAGAAALVKSEYPWATNAQIRQRLNDTTTPLGNAYYFGNGLVDASRAAY